MACSGPRFETKTKFRQVEVKVKCKAKQNITYLTTLSSNCLYLKFDWQIRSSSRDIELCWTLLTKAKSENKMAGVRFVSVQVRNAFGRTSDLLRQEGVASAVTIIVLRRLVFGFFLFSTDSKFRKQMMANAPSCPKMHWTRETHCRVSRVYFRALIGKVETIVPQSAKPKLTSLIWQ